MSSRELLNKHPKMTIGVVAGIPLLLLFLMSWRQHGESSAAGPGQAYFTDDDGKTWFTAPADQLTPFDHSGRQAVKAYLFTLDGGKTKFVGYLERHSESARKTLESSRQGTMVPLSELTAAANDVDVKAPGDALWIRRSDPAAKKIMNASAPQGSTGLPQLVQ